LDPGLYTLSLGLAGLAACVTQAVARTDHTYGQPKRS
jgi:hypothetical protein